MRRFAVILSFAASAAFPGAAASERPTIPPDMEARVYSVINTEGGGYKLYINAERTECVDGLASSNQVKLRLDRAADNEWNGSSVRDLRVRARLVEMEGFPASLQINDDGEILVSSSGGIFLEGRQIFLQCQDFTGTDYDVYFIEEVSGG